MWIHSRIPSPSASADNASSKSRALAGSTVKVASSVRSRRSCELPRAASAASRASDSSAGAKPLPLAAVRQQRVHHVPGALRRAQHSKRAGSPGPKSTSAISPGRRPPSRGRGPPAAPARTAARPPRSVLVAPRSRPSARALPRAGGSPVLDRRLLRQHRERLIQSLVPVGRRIVRGANFGLYSLARERRSVGRQVLANRQVERPARRRDRAPPGRCPCRTSGCPTIVAR